MGYREDLATIHQVEKDRAALERPATHFLESMAGKDAFLRFKDGETMPIKIENSKYGADTDRVNFTYIIEGERCDAIGRGVACIDDIFEQDPKITGEEISAIAEQARETAQQYAELHRRRPHLDIEHGSTTHLIHSI